MDLRTEVHQNIPKSNIFLGLQLDFFPLELDFFPLELDLEKVPLRPKKVLLSRKKVLLWPKKSYLKKVLLRPKKVLLYSAKKSYSGRKSPTPTERLTPMKCYCPYKKYPQQWHTTQAKKILYIFTWVLQDLEIFWEPGPHWFGRLTPCRKQSWHSTSWKFCIEGETQEIWG